MFSEIPDFDRINQLFEKNKAIFEAFYLLLSEYNARYNLTAITQREEVVHKHFLDSLAGERYFPSGAEAVEIGSGAGFPSLPLKIVRPDLILTLVESTGKKCDFLRAAVRELGLDGVTVVHARAEELGRDAKYRERFSVAFARAVAPLPALAEYCIPLIRTGGILLAYKGASEDMSAGKKAVETLGGGKMTAVRYSLPDGYGERTLITAEKVHPTPQKYPRGQGKERSAPIV